MKRGALALGLTSLSRSVKRQSLLLVGLTLVSLTGSACIPRDEAVTRVVGGRTQPGRYISVTAYFDYLRGAEAEAQGDLPAATAAYRRAIREDPNSPELWRRLATLDCQTGRPWQVSARAAIQLGPDYEPAWRAKALCHIKAGELTEAERALKRALSLDPTQEALASAFATLFRAQRKPREALAWLSAWVTWHPESVLGWRELRSVALELNDPASVSRADAALRALPRDPRAGLAPEPPPPDALERALAEGDLQRAQAAARALQLPAQEVARRAYLRGQTALAREQSRLLLAADPSCSDARVILLLLGDPHASRDLWAQPDPISPPFQALLDAALERAR
ncbi:MAG: tetratricopeptide repeat protein [Polyangiaceae bacterium]|nr:tetratricopeptide repeat protein [Polyangiaceae bacterium]MCW5791677.1 tetratricopeptide repeat protein [Polyangiaceae bacterium]